MHIYVTWSQWVKFYNIPNSHTENVLLTHWGRVSHRCVGKITIIGSDNGLSHGRCQAIIWTNFGILLIGPLGTNFNEILIEIYTFSFKKMHLKMSSGKRRPFGLGLNVLKFAEWTIWNGMQDTVRLGVTLILSYHSRLIPDRLWQYRGCLLYKLDRCVPRGRLHVYVQRLGLI